MKKPRETATGAGPGLSMAPNGREPDYYWSGKPVYRCHTKPGCQYERVENLAAVLSHEAGHQPQVRASRILGTDGEPLQVLGDHENE